jgi:hypothetical protein
MSGPAISQAYHYAFPSELRKEAGGPSLRLATSGGTEEHPWFFRGRLVSPRRTTGLLLGVSKISGTRFYTPPNMLARILAAADPVVTSSRDRLRFESFSACCSTYARVDMLPEATDGEVMSLGTTNVDFNGPMRAALAQVTESDAVRISVGADRVELERQGQPVVERKVTLPVRWLKGFVEVQAYQARMKLAFEAEGGEARRFLRALPRQATRNSPAAVESVGRGLRLTFREGVSTVPVVGTERLRPLEVLSADTRKLRIYSDGAASAWELVFDDARFVLVLSPEPSRGFSGEGQALASLARPAVQSAAAKVHARLRWDSRIDLDLLSKQTGEDRQTIATALAALGTRGIVGYDLAEEAYFHRELPFDLDLVEQLHPRLKDARELVQEGAVIRGSEEWQIRSKDVTHRVRITDQGPSCTCPWYGKHEGRRGPCKHVLAAQLFEGPDDPR